MSIDDGEWQVLTPKSTSSCDEGSVSSRNDDPDEAYDTDYGTDIEQETEDFKARSEKGASDVSSSLGEFSPNTQTGSTMFHALTTDGRTPPEDPNRTAHGRTSPRPFQAFVEDYDSDSAPGSELKKNSSPPSTPYQDPKRSTATLDDRTGTVTEPTKVTRNIGDALDDVSTKLARLTCTPASKRESNQSETELIAEGFSADQDTANVILTLASWLAASQDDTAHLLEENQAYKEKNEALRLQLSRSQGEFDAQSDITDYQTKRAVDALAKNDTLRDEISALRSEKSPLKSRVENLEFRNALWQATQAGHDARIKELERGLRSYADDRAELEFGRVIARIARQSSKMGTDSSSSYECARAER